MLVLYGDRR